MKSVSIKRLIKLSVISLTLFIFTVTGFYIWFYKKYPVVAIELPGTLTFYRLLYKLPKPITIFLICPPFGQTWIGPSYTGRCLKNCQGGETYTIVSLIKDDNVIKLCRDKYGRGLMPTPADAGHPRPCHCKTGWKEVITPEEICYKTYNCE